MKSAKNVLIQSGNKELEINETELACWDCKKQIVKGDEFAHYEHSDSNYFKCKSCHETDPQLHPQKCEVFSRIVGYIRPVEQWNPGKAQEWKDRTPYKI